VIKPPVAVRENVRAVHLTVIEELIARHEQLFSASICGFHAIHEVLECEQGLQLLKIDCIGP
jgi:hypothetical protein